jgi:nucleotide-binding universal stress UspA family protein
LEVPETVGAKGEELVRQYQGSMVEALLDRARSLLAQSFETVEVILREGVPSQEILHVIQEHQPDLVVSGMRGFYQAAGFAFGSVSQRLLAYAPCSLMLVPGKVTSRLGLRVMVATDGSPDALRAAGLLNDLPGVQEIVVVSVVRPLGAAQAVLDRFQGAESRTMRADLLRSRRAAARKAIAATLEVLKGRPANIRAVVLAGHPAEAIVRAARRDGVDLLVIGARGFTGVKALALGSVSHAVAQLATCPVLIVKP